MKVGMLLAVPVADVLITGGFTVGGEFLDETGFHHLI
jgi:hypothetical protein